MTHEAKKPDTTQQLQLPAFGAALLDGKYAGVLTDDDGQPYLLILLGAKPADRMTWQTANDWAQSAGAQLPNRVESAQLFRVLKSEFEERYHWTCERDSSGAWLQYFDYGSQDWCYGVDVKRCARAVRRSPLQSFDPSSVRADAAAA